MKNWFSLLILLLMCPPIHASTIQVPRSGQTIVHAVSDDGDIRAGKPWPNPRFSDNGNQTVTDNLTGLVWTRDANPMKSRDPGFDPDGQRGDAEVILAACSGLHQKIERGKISRIFRLASAEYQ